MFFPFLPDWPLLRYLDGLGVRRLAMIVPRLLPIPFWWPFMFCHISDQFCLGSVGDRNMYHGLQCPALVVML